MYYILELELPLLGSEFFSFALLITNLSWGMAMVILLLVFLVMSSALISGSEVAYFSLTPKQLEELGEERTNAGDRITGLRDIPRTLLATILISNNFVNIAIVILADFLVRSIFGGNTFISWAEGLQKLPLLETVSIDILERGISFTITVVGVTFILVLFGEVAPKILAKLNNVKFARFMSLPLIILTNVLGPISRLMVGWTKRIEKKMIPGNGTPSSANKEDIDKAIDLAVSKDPDSKREAAILKGIVKFNDVPVKQVMRSRVDVLAVDQDTNFKELVKTIKNHGYSRVPVFQDDFDSIVGILYAKDLLGNLDAGPDFKWQNLIRTDILYIPESKKLNEALKEFQKEHLHMGIVVDEFGGTSGIVTLEDVMEEVIGEIKDEFDFEDEVEFKQLGANVFVFEGKTMLNDMCRIISIDTNSFDKVRGDADSIAGLILEIAEKIPKKGQEFNYQEFQFKIMSVTKRRIERIRITVDR